KSDKTAEGETPASAAKRTETASPPNPTAETKAAPAAANANCPQVATALSHRLYEADHTNSIKEFTARCIADKWNDELGRCLAKAVTDAELEYCRNKATPAQRVWLETEAPGAPIDPGDPPPYDRR